MFAPGPVKSVRIPTLIVLPPLELLPLELDEPLAAEVGELPATDVGELLLDFDELLQPAAANSTAATTVKAANSFLFWTIMFPPLTNQLAG